jgi:hypothetical protein
MATFAFVVPVIPGKEETDRETIVSGDEKDAYNAARRSLGFQREAIWHQVTPDGALAIVVWEAEDIEQAFGGIPTSDEPFDQRFRRFLQDVHGIDVANDPPPSVRQVIDHRFKRAAFNGPSNRCPRRVPGVGLEPTRPSRGKRF